MSVDRQKHDVLILGGGPGGSVAAMHLAREGIRAHILEQEKFPRFHIGESMTGAAGQLLRDLGLEQKMLAAKHPRKRGVNVYGADDKGHFWVPVAGRDADWKLFPWETWQVRRAEFDQMLLDEAVSRGATTQQAHATAPLVDDSGKVVGLKGTLPDGHAFEYSSEIVLDCSGQSTFLANAGVTGPKYLGNYDKQIAIFSHVKNAIRDDDSSAEKCSNNTLILYKKKFFWAWFIPIDDEVTSVGVVVPAAYYREKRESLAVFLERELRELHPELARRCPDREFVEGVHVIPNYSFQVRRFTGKGFICIGDAHRFIDPIYSFGLTVTMQEGQFAAPIVREYLEGKRRDTETPFADYQLKVEQGADVLEDMIDMFWEHPLAFAFCAHHRHRDEMIDMFAGRIYDHQPSKATLDFRKVLGRDRNRWYDTPDEYSIPIGSRYHPERAPIWNDTSAELRPTEG